MDVVEWQRGLGLEQYALMFYDNDMAFPLRRLARTAQASSNSESNIGRRCGRS
jgi:hypothetical protein